MAEITIVTLVHNPGKYIYPCVDSVLGQTFSDFEYVIVDNASSDGTKEVLEAYAAKDERIKLCRNEENNVKFINEDYVSTEYYMILDHDDYLEPDALELLYALAVKENLDIVFGKCEMVDANGKALAEEGISKDIACIEGTDLWRHFSDLYWQMRTLWGKLIRRDMMKYVDYETLRKREKSFYAGDTVVMLSMSFAANRIGTVNKVLHHYRILERSESRSYCRDRFLADWVVLEQAINLLEKQNGLSWENTTYVYRVYCSAICDTLRIAIKSNAPEMTKIEIIEEILTNGYTSKMLYLLEQHGYNEYREFVELLGPALMALYMICGMTEQCQNVIYIWLSLLYDKIRGGEYSVIYKRYRGIMLLLCMGKGEQAYRDIEKEKCLESCPELYLLLALRYENNVKRMAQIIWETGRLQPEIYQKTGNAIRILIEQNQILRNADHEIFEEHPELVALICAEEYVEAANLCFALLETEKWQRSGGVLDLAMTLVAILEDGEAFVFLEKCKCEFLIRENKLDKAKATLAELIEMCPDDEEVKTLAAELS